MEDVSPSIKLPRTRERRPPGYAGSKRSLSSTSTHASLFLFYPPTAFLCAFASPPSRLPQESGHVLERALSISIRRRVPSSKRSRFPATAIRARDETIKRTVSRRQYFEFHRERRRSCERREIRPPPLRREERDTRYPKSVLNVRQLSIETRVYNIFTVGASRVRRARAISDVKRLTDSS